MNQVDETSTSFIRTCISCLFVAAALYVMAVGVYLIDTAQSAAGCHVTNTESNFDRIVHDAFRAPACALHNTISS